MEIIYPPPPPLIQSARNQKYSPATFDHQKKRYSVQMRSALNPISCNQRQWWVSAMKSLLRIYFICSLSRARRLKMAHLRSLPNKMGVPLKNGFQYDRTLVTLVLPPACVGLKFEKAWFLYPCFMFINTAFY